MYPMNGGAQGVCKWLVSKTGMVWNCPSMKWLECHVVTWIKRGAVTLWNQSKHLNMCMLCSSIIFLSWDCTGLIHDWNLTNRLWFAGGTIQLRADCWSCFCYVRIICGAGESGQFLPQKCGFFPLDGFSWVFFPWEGVGSPSLNIA